MEYCTETPKIDFLNAYLSLSAVMFCKQFLAYTVYIDMSVFFMQSIYIQVGFHIYLC